MKLEAIDISKSYDGKQNILTNISLCAETGNTISISAPSGMGKSTLLSILGLLLKPTSGELFLDGREISGLPDAEKAKIRNRNFGFIFQSTQLIGSLTALENVCIPALLAGEQKTKRAIELLEEFGLCDRMDYYPHQLSIGQQRRVSIARALLMNPRFVFADEPTNDLDPANSAAISQCLLALPSQERALILVTHDVEFANQADYRFQITKDGNLSHLM